MAALVEQGMSEGAIGLSSGLEYEVGSYSETEELVALSKAAARHGGFYMSHIRDEADKRVRGLRARRSRSASRRTSRSRSRTSSSAPSASGSKSAEVVKMIEAARKRGVDVTADCYPYDAWHSTITVLVPEQAVRRPGQREEGAATTSAAPQNVTIDRDKAHPEYEFKTLEEIAKAKGITPVDALHPDRQGRRRQRHRQVDGRGGHPALLHAAVGDGRERRRHRPAPSAQRRHVPARARPKFVREQQLVPARGGDPQDDVRAGRAAEARRPRHDRRRARPPISSSSIPRRSPIARRFRIRSSWRPACAPSGSQALPSGTTASQRRPLPV